jgi:hypothetical protein
MRVKPYSKVIIIAIIIFVLGLFQVAPVVQVSAADILDGGIEFFNSGPNRCLNSATNCDALEQYGMASCVTTAANNNSFYTGSGATDYWAALSNYYSEGRTTTKTFYSPGTVMLMNLLAYYYGVDVQSFYGAKTNQQCPVQENTALPANEIYSLDNIGAAFDILSIVYGYNIPNSSFTYHKGVSGTGPYVVLNNVISLVTNDIYNSTQENLVCSQFMSEPINTGMDISSLDVGKTPSTGSKPMYGILNPNKHVSCPHGDGNFSASDYLDLIDIHCGNLSKASPYIAKTFTPKCEIMPDSTTPTLGSSVSVYINWHLADKSYNPYATQVENIAIQKSVNSGVLLPIGLPPPLNGTVVLGQSGYVWNQTDSNSNPITLVDSPSSTTAQTIAYSGSLTYVLNSGQNISITCTPATIIWSSTVPVILLQACTLAGEAQQAAQTNVYNPAYQNWYNYDQISVGAPLGGYQAYKKATDKAATTLGPSLQTYLNDVALYYAILNNKPQPPAYNPPAYNPPAYNPPAYNPPVYNPPAPPPGNSTITRWLNYFKQLASYKNSYNKQLTSYKNSYNQQLTTYNTSYNKQLTSYKNSYNQQLTAYNTSYNIAYNNYVIALSNWNTNLANAKAAAIAAYNAMQLDYQVWVPLSEQTYNSTTLYYDNGPAPNYFYSTVSSNPINSYYNQDLNRYNATVAALNIWKAAYHKQATVCDTQPYFTVSGGDVIAGSGSANSNGYCSPNDSANIFASNVGGPSWTGASDNLSALAPSVINGLSTGTGGDQLTFANTSPPYGGSFGSANGVCNLDYYSTRNGLAGFSVNPANGPLFDISSVTYNSACQPINTTYYCKLNGPINITQSSSSASTLTKAVLYVTGSAEIGGTGISIYNYANTLNSASDIPLLYVISNSNIYIDNTVTSTDGVYAATAGTIFTCASAGSSFSSDKNLIAECNSPLTVNGSLVASQIRFGRVYGGFSAQNNWPVGSAETFNYGPEIWLSQVQSSMPINPAYQDLTELSPVI